MYSHWYNHTQSPMIITNVEVSRDSKTLEPFELNLDDEIFENGRGNKCVVVIESRSASTAPSELRRLFLNKLSAATEGGDDDNDETVETQTPPTTETTTDNDQKDKDPVITDVSTNVTTEITSEIGTEVTTNVATEIINGLSPVNIAPEILQPLDVIAAVISMGAAETRTPEDYSKYLFSPIEKE